MALILKTRSMVIGGALVVAAALVVYLFQGAQVVPKPRDDWLDNVETIVVPIRDNVFVLQGMGDRWDGGNITVLVGAKSLLVVDTQYAPLTMQNLAAIRSQTPLPIRYIVNTHGHPDHVGGNADFRDSGTSAVAIAAGGAGAGPGGATIIAHENVVPTMVAAGWGERWLPTQLYSGDGFEFMFEDEPVRLEHHASAHTDGDSFVYFEAADVVSVGDIYNGVMYPIIDRWKGGTVGGILDGLNALVSYLERAGAEGHPVVVVPGHGDPAGIEEVAEFRDMVQTVTDRVRAMVDAGMSLDDIQTARPTQDFDALYEPSFGRWKATDFVEAIYLDLSR